MSNPADITRNKELAIHKRNLQRLREQAASYGLDVPLHLFNQITHEEEQITFLESSLGHGLPAEVQPTQNKSVTSTLEHPTSSAIPTGIVTFLCFDIANSVEQWEQDAQAFQQAVNTYDALVKQAVADNQGFIVWSSGERESQCVAFDQATDAVAAASQLMQSFTQQLWPTREPPGVRMALLTGQTDIVDGEYVGITLNHCVLLRNAAYPGQILVSRPTIEFVRGALPAGCQVKDLGQHKLTNVRDTVHILQLLAPGCVDTFPPLSSSALTNLPLQLSTLIGRQADVVKVKGWLLRSDIRLLVLIGSGGVGKTRLAYQVGTELLDHFPDGVYTVELEPERNAAMLPTAISRVLGVQEEAGVLVLESIKRALSGKQMLLVLDCFEHVVGGAPIISELLKAAPNLKIMVTSQAPLNVGTDVRQVYQVPPLELPQLHPVRPSDAPRRAPPRVSAAEAAALALNPAIQLFVDCAQRARSSFVLDEGNARIVAEICVLLDGLPLAIELAAAHIESMAPATLLAALQDRFAILRTESVDKPTRQQYLWATIDWSFELLSRAQQQMLPRLTVFSGNWTEDDAQAICTEQERVHGLSTNTTVQPYATPRRPLGEASAFVANGLLRQLDASDQYWYSMPQSVRAYVLGLLAEDELEALRTRHATYYLQSAIECEQGLSGGDQDYWLMWFELQHDNLYAAFDWFLAQKDGVSALQLGSAMWRFWLVRGHFTFGSYLMGAALKLGITQGEAVPVAVRAQAYNTVGGLAWMQGRGSEAQNFYRQSLALWQSLEDTRGTATALNNLGIIARSGNNLSEAQRLFIQALPLFRKLNDRINFARVLSNLGVIAHELGDEEQARSYYNKSLAIRRELGDNSGIVIALINLGVVALAQREYERAQELYHDALKRSIEIKDQESIARCFEGLAEVATADGDFGRAARLAGYAAKMRTELAAPLEQAEQRRYQGVIAAASEKYGSAAWSVACSQGESMKAEEALALALS